MIEARATAASGLSADAMAAAALLAVDGVGLGGALIRAGSDPLSATWLEIVRALGPADAPLRRAPAHIDESRLIGGLDLAATLAAGRPRIARGVLAEAHGGVLVLSQAERCSPTTAALIAAAMDSGGAKLEREGLSQVAPARFALIAFDEGAGPEEATPTLLAERIGLHLSGLRGDPPSGPALDRQDVDRAREALQRMAFDEDAAEALCAIADRFAVGSIRAVTFALRAARAWAALNGRKAIAEDDLLMAARLVLVPRAGALEAIQPEPEPEAAPPPDTSTNDETPEPSQTDAAADRVIDAVRASLPDGLLDQLASQLAARKAHAAGRGAGPKARAARRGAPLPSRPGALGAGDVLDLTATLRAAAPWRRVRTPPPGARTVVPLRGSDFRVRRFKQRQEQSIVFAVDASGSMAAQRLGEAKGAVEHLLAQAYVTRAHAALIAFRQQSAEVLLAPTRSLAAAKRRLAELPGGGATPLAAAIEAAVRVAVSERSRQRTPLIVFLTDGRGNVGRDGAPGRAAAEADALAAADLVRAAGLSTVLIDTSPHARPQAAALADRMGASYVALPIVDAGRVAEIVRAHAPVG